MLKKVSIHFYYKHKIHKNHLLRMLRLYIILMVIILPIFQACQPREHTEKYTIAFSQCIGNDAWRQTMLEEMKRELSFYPNVQFIYRDAQGNNQTQIAQIRELLKNKIDLLIVSPNEAAPVTPIVDSVFRLKIPVVVTDRKTSSGLYNAYVGADNLAIGKLAGQFISTTLQGKGQIGIITGLSGTSASIERKKGLIMGLDSAGTTRIGVDIQGDWSKNTAYANARKQINDLKNQDLIFAFNDQMAFGTIQSLTETGINNKRVIGVDALSGQGNGLEKIADGTLYASMFYPTGGTEAVRTAMSILEQKPYTRENILGTLVINKENANLMILQSNKIKGQQKDIDKRQQLIDRQYKIYNSQRTTLRIVLTSLIITVILGTISIIVIRNNRKKNRLLNEQNQEILSQQQQIVDMNQQIRNAAEEQRGFFTNVSHEFKTPLTLIMGPLEELSKENTLSPTGLDHLLYIKRNTLKLQDLIRDLIDIHRIDKSKLTLQAECVHINSFIQQIVSNFKPLAKKKGISLSYINKSPINKVWIDEHLMEHALSNLLSNAFKYTTKGGGINILVDENTFGDYFHIRIIDNGTGISAGDIDQIFDNFYQGEDHQLGSGIGLAYVKQIVELHHGQVTASSKKGAGSAFTLRLPVGDHHLSPEEKKNTVQPTTRFDFETALSQESIEEHDSEMVSFCSDRASTILIVEDHSEIRSFLKEILATIYNITFATNYADALKKMETNYPDLIISDIMLPDETGIELLKTVKKSLRFNQVPVLLLTAVDTEESKIEGMRYMADAYLTKPFHVDHLKAVIVNLITSRQKLKEHYSGLGKAFEIQTETGHTSQDKRFIQNLAMVVESHLGNKNLSIEDIAKELRLSRIQLYRKTKTLLNCSVNDFLLQRRLTKSQHLLLEGLQVNEIAEKVGFSSGTYFTAVFKKYFGITPTVYRKEQIKKDI